MIRAWVLGSGGMLGNALRRELLRRGVNLYCYRESFVWSDTQKLKAQLALAAKEFFDGLSHGDSWEIYWAAGVGSMGSVAKELLSETAALNALLCELQKHLSGECCTTGSFGFASSAGALYSGCQDFEVSESSAVSAVTDYAQAKLSQELLLQDFVKEIKSVKLLIARFSTLYGFGQSIGKPQGLLSHVARCALRRQPVEIFVPLDTTRDYLFVDDAASDFVESLCGMRDENVNSRIKIIAAETSSSIAEVISTFHRLMKRPVRIICRRTKLSGLYAPRVSYRSLYPSRLARHTLLQGVDNLLRFERMAYTAGVQREDKP